MESFRNILKKLFLYYETDNDYHFTLSENADEGNKNPDNPASNMLDKKTVSASLDDNYNHIQFKYNSLINSDIILRKFQIVARGKKYSALLVCIDGMVDSDLLNNYMLKPLMKLNRNIKLNSQTNNSSIMKNSKVIL